MALPIVEQIARALAVQLATITTANGYEHDVEAVVRPGRAAVRPQHGLLTIEQGEKTPADEAACGSEEWVQPFTLIYWLKPGDASEAPIDGLANMFGADVEKAVKADPQWASLAIDSWVSAGEAVQTADAAFDGLALTFNVLFRHALGDPYSAP